MHGKGKPVKRSVGVLSMLGALMFSSPALADGEAVFEKILGLAGNWVGITYWSTDPSKREEVRMTYQPTGLGSAVVEHFSTGTEPTMTSVYHMDGNDLRLTHFCSAKNQPRLKATRIDDGGRVVVFSLEDVTNLTSPGAGHVSGLELRFPAEDHLELKFTFSRDGRDIFEFIELARAP